MTFPARYQAIKLLNNVSSYGAGPAIQVTPNMTGPRTIFVYGTNFGGDGSIYIQFSPDGENFWTTLTNDMIINGPNIANTGNLLLDDGGLLQLDDGGLLIIVESNSFIMTGPGVRYLRALPLGVFIRAFFFGTAGSPSNVNVTIG